MCLQTTPVVVWRFAFCEIILDTHSIQNPSLFPSPQPYPGPSLTLGPSPEGRGKHDAPFSSREKGGDEGRDATGS
jgi:hypothetical protein